MKLAIFDWQEIEIKQSGSAFKFQIRPLRNAAMLEVMATLTDNDEQPMLAGLSLQRALSSCWDDSVRFIGGFEDEQPDAERAKALFIGEVMLAPVATQLMRSLLEISRLGKPDEGN